MINWREIERIEIRTEIIFNTAVIIFDSQGRSSVPPKIKCTDYLKNESVSRSRNWCRIQFGILHL